jgi:hypothetical protein
LDGLRHHPIPEFPDWDGTSTYPIPEESGMGRNKYDRLKQKVPENVFADPELYAFNVNGTDNNGKNPSFSRF